MRAIFAHGLKFHEDSSGKLYLRGYDSKYWHRYLKHFDELYVIGRKSHISDEALNGYNEFHGDNLHFVEVPEIHQLGNYRRNIKRTNTILENVIKLVDVVIARVPGTYSSMSIKLAKKHCKPYLIEMVGCPWDAYWNHSIKGKLVAPALTVSTKRIVRNAPYVIYVTNDFLQKRYPTEGKYTNCSNVTLPLLSEDVLERRLKKIKNIKNNQKVILGTTAAVDVRYKGQQYIIEALGKLKKQGILNYEYQLVGGGDHSYLKSVAKEHDVEDHVKFMGSLTHEKVFEWLDGIDLYTQPSRQEGLPRALIEALSRGLPSFGAKTGGIPELLESKYIFSNTNQNIDEICSILAKMTQDVMLEQSERNFLEAKKYESTIIENRRENFFNNFLN